jgi:hypothetical protein
MRHAVTLVVLFAFAAPLLAEDKDRYAAVGYSTQTGKYWFSWGMESAEKAEAEVKKHFDEKATIISGKNCYFAIARTRDAKAFGVGQGETPKEAETMALAIIHKQTKQKVYIDVVLHTAQGVGGDAYSAIAFSKSTGNFAAAVAKASATQAEMEALHKCEAKDAKIVVSTKNECCALALGKDKGVFGVGKGTTEKEAQEKALEECKKHTSECQIVASVAGKK